MPAKKCGTKKKAGKKATKTSKAPMPPKPY